MERANHQPSLRSMPPAAAADEAMTPAPAEGVSKASATLRQPKLLSLSLCAQPYKSIMHAHFRLFGPERFPGGSNIELEIALRLFHSLKSRGVAFAKLPRSSELREHEVDDCTALKKIRQDLNRRKETYAGWKNKNEDHDSSLLVVTTTEFKEMKKRYAQGDVPKGEAIEMTLDTAMVQFSSVVLDLMDKLNHGGTENTSKVNSNEQAVHDRSSTAPSSKTVATPSAKSSNTENASPNALVSKLPLNVPSDSCLSKKIPFPLEAMLAGSSTAIRVRVDLPKKARTRPSSKQGAQSESTPKASKLHSRKTPGRPRTKFVTPSASASKDGKYICMTPIKRAAFQHACSGIKSANEMTEGQIDSFVGSNELEEGTSLSSNEEAKPPKKRRRGRPRKNPIDGHIAKKMKPLIESSSESARPSIREGLGVQRNTGLSLKSGNAKLGHQEVSVSPETARDNPAVTNPILFEHPLDNVVYENADSMYDALWLSKSDIFAVHDKEVIVPVSIDMFSGVRPKPVVQTSTDKIKRDSTMLTQNIELRTNYFSPSRLPQSSSGHEQPASNDCSNTIPNDVSTSTENDGTNTKPVASTSNDDSQTYVRTKRLSFMPTTNVELQTNSFSPFRPIQSSSKHEHFSPVGYSFEESSSKHEHFAPVGYSFEEVNSIPVAATPSKEQCDASMVEFSWRSTASYHPVNEIAEVDLPSLDENCFVIHPSECKDTGNPSL